MMHEAGLEEVPISCVFSAFILHGIAFCRVILYTTCGTQSIKLMRMRLIIQKDLYAHYILPIDRLSVSLTICLPYVYRHIIVFSI